MGSLRRTTEARPGIAPRPLRHPSPSNTPTPTPTAPRWGAHTWALARTTRPNTPPHPPPPRDPPRTQASGQGAGSNHREALRRTCTRPVARAVLHPWSGRHAPGQGAHCWSTRATLSRNLTSASRREPGGLATNEERFGLPANTHPPPARRQTGPDGQY